MNYQIKHKISGSILFELECGSLKLCVEAAVKRDANLSCANLSGANLRGADLSDANLSGANLRGADLRDANLRDADLRGANLHYANLSDVNLSGANLSGADLSCANLSDANLSDADLSDADLSDANLSGADLSDANLLVVRDDFWAVLSAAPHEINGLRKALVEGRINGSTYEGECACLVGTIANVCHKNYKELEILKPNSSRPAERFFLSIYKGDRPETNQFSKLAVEWIDLWVNNVKGAF